MIVEDSEDDTLLLVHELRCGGYEPYFEQVETHEAMRSALQGRTWDIILADYTIPHFSGLDALRLLQESGIDLPFIIVSGNIGEEIAVEAMKAGAHDYIMKGNFSRLVPAIERELVEAIMRQDRKRMEEELRNSKETMRALINATTESALLIDTKGTVLALNVMAAERLGKGTRELVGSNIYDYFPADVAQKGGDYLDQVISSGHPVRFVGEHQGNWFDISVYPVHDVQGKISRVAVYGQDITERRHAHEELENNVRFLQALIDTIPSPIFYENVKGEYLGCNTAFEKFIGRNRKDIIGSTVYEVAPEDFAKVHEDADRTLFQREGKQIYQAKVRSSNGSDRDVIFNRAMFLKPDGEVGGIVGVILDITELKQAENTLRASHEQLLNLLSHLQSVREEERLIIAREIHDDLGQMLTALKMDLSWLGKRLPKNRRVLVQGNEEILKLVDQTIEAVKRICMELRPSVLDDIGLTAAIEWQAQEIEKRAGIKVELTTDPEDMVVERDLSVAMFRILQEVLANVVRHADATSVEVSLRRKQGFLELTVRDNGKGIKEEQILNPRSFGLIGIRERVQFMKGTVHITGIPGQGTTIIVKIPLGRTEGGDDKNPHR